MKRTTLTGLFITAAFLASPVFAADDLCATNLQKIQDEQTTTAAVDAAQGKDLQTAIDAAKAAQAKGDTKECIALTTKTLDTIDKTSKGNSAGK